MIMGFLRNDPRDEHVDRTEGHRESAKHFRATLRIQDYLGLEHHVQVGA